MKLRASWQALVGIACGLLIWLWASGGSVTPAGRDRPGVLISECDGALRTLVMQYVPQAGFVERTYRQFLQQLPAGVVVYVVCPDHETYQALLAKVGPVPCTLSPVIALHPMTTWSRDRWVALRTEPEPSGAGVTVLFAPRQEAGAVTWPTRAGDQQIAVTLANALPNLVVMRRSSLFFDGGDLLADSDTVFVTPAVVQRNLQQTVQTPEELLADLEEALHKKVVLLRDAPEHHAGMYMMAAGTRTMLVGDSSLARDLWESGKLWPDGVNKDAWQPDFSAQTQKRFDAVAEQVAQEGYRVLRVPTVPGMDGKAFVTYVNGVIDQRDGVRTVYMPTYRDLEPLNAMAAKVWQSIGYQVRRVDCTDVFTHFGTLHCLTNVVDKQ